MWSDAEDWELRLEAMQWLRDESANYELPLTYRHIRRFTFHGEPFALLDRERGIRKPAQLGAALSIRTVFRPEGAERPYDDGLLSYKWRGNNAQHAENRALRAAYERRLPLIWFVGVAPGRYEVRAPVHIKAEVPQNQEFLLDIMAGIRPEPGDSRVEEVLRSYLQTEVLRRLHQPRFRQMVMHAYRERCSICSLGHVALLDAAHIVPDRDEQGVAAVRNGLALCKIHHAAYDSGLVGISPDYRVAVRDDVLAEVDGPMLRHGLQDVHDTPLRVLPRRHGDRPDPELLDLRWQQFRRSA